MMLSGKGIASKSENLDVTPVTFYDYNFSKFLNIKSLL